MIISSFHLGLGVCFLHISLGPHINPFGLASIESRNFIDLLIEYIFNGSIFRIIQIESTGCPSRAYMT